MSTFDTKAYKVFEMFNKQWALATSGDLNNYNSCTIGWGSMGTLWTKPGSTGSTMTVYLHPGRYTTEFFKANDTFTVSFFPREYRKALAVMGTRSGRDGDKAAAAGLTPVAMGDSVTFAEAELTFLCKKIYQHQFAKEDIPEYVRENYINDAKTYPHDENGEYQPHWVFVGEIIDAEDKTEE